MKTQILTLAFSILIVNIMWTQVGIGTTNPDASSVLDITATDKGILIPRVSLNNIATTMLDGVNTASTGLLIYNNNPATTGGSGVGYYTFNGTLWEKLITTSSSANDHDFYEEGTTTSPNDINDDQFTMGNLAIGKNTADWPLEIEVPNGGRGVSILMNGSTNLTTYGLYSEVSNSGSGMLYGNYNDISSSNNNSNYGVYNDLKSTGNLTVGTSNVFTAGDSVLRKGVFNDLSGGLAITQYGVHNLFASTITGADDIGVFNEFNGVSNGNVYGTRQLITNSGSGEHYGMYNNLTGSGGGNKYGSFNLIDSAAGGTHYAGYFDAPGGNNDFAAVFNRGHVVANEAGDDYDFRIEGDNEENLFIADASTDRIGIGVVTPSTKLHVVGGTDASISGGGYITSGNLNGQNIVIDENEIMARNNGGISNLNLQVEGGSVTVGGAVVHASDRRLKKDIEDLHYSLNELLLLQPKQYHWKNRKSTSYKSFGLIAQDVQKILPELVLESDNEEKTLSVNYTELIPILLNAIQEQQQIIDSQKLENNQQKAELKILNKNVRALLSRVDALELINNQ